MADIVFPSKVITLMSSARAIIASASPGSEVARVLKEADAGLLVAPEDPHALLDAILALRKDPERRRKIGENGRAFAQRYWEKQRTLAVLEANLLRVAARDTSHAARLASAIDKQLLIDGKESQQ